MIEPYETFTVDCLVHFRAFVVNLANHNTVRVFRIGKKEDGSPGNIAAAIDFPQVYTQGQS